MRLLHRLLVCAVPASLLALGSSPAVTTAQELPVIRFLETDPLALTWAELTDDEGEKVELIYNGAVQPFLPINVDYRLATEDGVALPAGALTIEPATAELQAASSLTITLKAVGQEPPSESYSGYLVVYTQGRGQPRAFARRELTIQASAAGDAPIAFKPLRDTWNVAVYRCQPFSLRCFWPAWLAWLVGETPPPDDVLPLAVGTAVAPRVSPPPAPLGVLQNDQGNAIAVRWTGNVTTTLGYLPDIPGLLVTYDDLGNAGTGTYKGSLDLDPAKDGGNVTLTLSYKDAWMMPFLAIMAGLFAALLLSRVNNVLLIWLVLRWRELWLWRSLSGAQQAFNKVVTRPGQTTPQPFNTYDIVTAASGLRSKIKENTAKIPRFSLTQLDETDVRYTSVLTDLQLIDDAQGSWAEFAGELVKLNDEIQDLETKLDQAIAPPGLENVSFVQPESSTSAQAASNKPLFLASALALLDGTNFKIEDYAERRAKVQQAFKLTESWLELNEQAQSYWDWSEKLSRAIPQSDTTQREQLAEAKVKINQAWFDLWRAPNLEALHQQQTDTTLEDAENLLSGLTYYLAPRVELESLQAGALGATQPGMAVNTALRQVWDYLFAALSDDRKRERFFELGLRAWGCLLIIIANAVAVLSGLTALYIGKPFGTPLDYIQAFVWGFVTPLALEALLGVANRLWKQLQPAPG